MVTVNCIEQRPCPKVGMKVTVIGLIYLLFGTLAHYPVREGLFCRNVTPGINGKLVLYHITPNRPTLTVNLMEHRTSWRGFPAFPVK